MSEEAPPLKVWAYPLVIFFTIALSILGYAYSDYGPYPNLIARSNENLQKALAEMASDTSAVSVVILGSSVTEYAISNPRQLEESISQATNKKTKVLRVALNYMTMNLARRINFFEYVSENPPDYLFIESFGLNFDDVDSVSKIPVPIDATLMHLRNDVRMMLGAQTHDNFYVKWYTFDHMPSPESDFHTHHFDSVTYRMLQTKKCAVRKLSRNPEANKAYAALKKNNSKVIFLGTPQANEFPTNFIDEPATADFNEMLRLYKEQYNVDYWPFASGMDDSCFSDGIHLNSKGSMQYQKWFVSEFASKK